jgi:hypothetical protein
MAENTLELGGSLKMLTRVAASKTEFRMSSWANVYRGLANEARLRAAQTASLSEKDKFIKGCDGVVSTGRMGRTKAGIVSASDSLPNIMLVSRRLGEPDDNAWRQMGWAAAVKACRASFAL